MVWVNGVPSLNASSGRSNAETNFVSTTGTDERWLAVWARTVFKTDAPYAASAPNANHAAYPSMTMNGNTPVFAYVNNVQGYGLAEYWNGTTEWKIYENWDLFTFTAIDLNSSGNHAALYDINVVQARHGQLPDDKGGILTSFFYQPPNTTWNGTSYYYRDYNIWLDNLFKSGAPPSSAATSTPTSTCRATAPRPSPGSSTASTTPSTTRCSCAPSTWAPTTGSVGSTNKITDNTVNGHAISTRTSRSRTRDGTWPDVHRRVGDEQPALRRRGTNAGISPPNAYTVDTGRRTLDRGRRAPAATSRSWPGTTPTPTR